MELNYGIIMCDILLVFQQESYILKLRPGTMSMTKTQAGGISDHQRQMIGRNTICYLISCDEQNSELNKDLYTFDSSSDFFPLKATTA